jgi:hypothetical protein
MGCCPSSRATLATPGDASLRRSTMQAVIPLRPPSPTVGTSEDEDDSLEPGSANRPFDSGTSDVNRPTVGSVASGQDSHYGHHGAGNDDQSHHGQDGSNNGFEQRDFVQHESDYPLLVEDRPSLVIRTNELARVIEPVRSD